MRKLVKPLPILVTVVIVLLAVYSFHLKSELNNYSSYINQKLDNDTGETYSYFSQANKFIKKSLTKKSISNDQLNILTNLYSNIATKLNDLETIETYTTDSKYGETTKQTIYSAKVYFSNLSRKNQTLILDRNTIDTFNKLVDLNESMIEVLNFKNNKPEIGNRHWASFLNDMDQIIHKKNYYNFS